MELFFVGGRKEKNKFRCICLSCYAWNDNCYILCSLHFFGGDKFGAPCYVPGCAQVCTKACMALDHNLTQEASCTSLVYRFLDEASVPEYLGRCLYVAEDRVRLDRTTDEILKAAERYISITSSSTECPAAPKRPPPGCTHFWQKHVTNYTTKVKYTTQDIYLLNFPR